MGTDASETPGADDAADAPFWVFGYGSLIWRPGFPFVERSAAWLGGFARRFWQGSVDHRGVPGAPGRVVTLVPAADAVCHGVAFRVEAERAGEVLEQLDHRERGGFTRLELEVGLARGRLARAFTWVADAENPNYLGPAPLEAIAAQVRSSRGPSGSNLEYVLELARALREIEADDAHVFSLERRVLEEG